MENLKNNMLTTLVLFTALCYIPSRAQTLPVVVQKTTNCATSVDGSVVGILNPLTAPILSAVYSGTLPPATYYVVIAWYDVAGHVTLASPEVEQLLSAPGGVTVNPPASGVPVSSGALGMKVYLGTSPGTETLQGTTTGTAAFTQSVPLIAGTALPTVNTTVCEQIANDAGWPTGTGYNVSLTDANGNTLPGYPMQWQLLGPGTTLDLNQGLPLYNGTVLYPVPILARPYNHALQSLSGPLSLTGYNLTGVGKIGIGTSLPAWGIDAEYPSGGDPLEGAVNAKTGYLINGAGGTAGQCLGSDGTYFDTIISCLSTLPTFYYQTDQANGTSVAQQPINNFLSPLVVTPATGKTNIGLNTVGTGAYVPMAAGLGVSGDCQVWNAAGIGDSGQPCGTVGFTSGSNANGYWTKDPLGHIHQWGHITGETSNTCALITFPVAFTTAASIVPTVSDDFGSGANVQHAIAYNSATCTSGPSTTGMYDRPSAFGTGGENGAWWSADGY